MGGGILILNMRNYEYLQFKWLTGGNLASAVNYEHKDKATQKR